MNPQSRPTSTREPATLRRSARAQVGDDGEAPADLPTLASILARYREHGTLARSVAAWDPAQSQSLPCDLPVSISAAAPSRSPRPFKEVIEGLQTRELDGGDLFDQFFGSAPSKPSASR